MTEKQYIIDTWEPGESWRLFRIISEFVEGIEELHHVYPTGEYFREAPGRCPPTRFIRPRS